MHDLRGKRVLVVEDDYLIGIMVSDMLMNAGALVIGPARTRDQGLTIARTESLDVAVLDLNLRGESGDQIAAELRRRDIPFVIATSYSEQARAERINAPVLEKPFTEEMLLDVLDELLADEGANRHAGRERMTDSDTLSTLRI